MQDFEVKYHIREPVRRNSRSGAIKYQNDGYPRSPITVSATDATEARKKAGKHPAILSAKEKANGRIDSSVQEYGGKARHKVDEVKPKTKPKRLSGRGGGGTMTPIKPQDRTGLSGPLRRKMNKGGPVKKKAKK